MWEYGDYYTCSVCKKRMCDNHRIPESHGCRKAAEQEGAYESRGAYEERVHQDTGENDEGWHDEESRGAYEERVHYNKYNYGPSNPNWRSARESDAAAGRPKAKKRGVAVASVLGVALALVGAGMLGIVDVGVLWSAVLPDESTAGEQDTDRLMSVPELNGYLGDGGEVNDSTDDTEAESWDGLSAGELRGLDDRMEADGSGVVSAMCGDDSYSDICDSLMLEEDVEKITHILHCTADGGSYLNMWTLSGYGEALSKDAVLPFPRGFYDCQMVWHPSGWDGAMSADSASAESEPEPEQQPASDPEADDVDVPTGIDVLADAVTGIAGVVERDDCVGRYYVDTGYEVACADGSELFQMLASGEFPGMKHEFVEAVGGVEEFDAVGDAARETEVDFGNTLVDTAGNEAAEWKSYMLELINAERTAAGLGPVTQGDNPAAQIHADNMLDGCFSSHWGLDGLKPYMRYSIAGGYQYNAENISGLSYCITGGNYVATSPERDVREAVDGFMQSPGHRDTILDPHNAKVNLGLAWDDYNMMVVQHFEYDYVSFEEPPAIRDGVLSFSGTALNGAGFRSADDMSVQIYYDPPPRNLAPGQVARTYCYDLGTVVAALVPPPPPGSYYTTSSYQVADIPCPDPYDVPADAPAPASYDQAHAAWRQSYLDSMSAPSTTLTVPFQSAAEWSISGDDFAVGDDIKSLLQERGPGVYTIVVWGVADGEDVVIAERSIFYQTDPPGGYG